MDEFESFAQENQPNLVRPYTLTAGRTDSRVNLPLEAPIEAVVSDKPPRWPGNDVRAQICAMCGSSPSVAEIAAHLSLPVGVARVLIGDLVSGASAGAHHLERPLQRRRTARTDRKDPPWLTSALRATTKRRRRSSSPAASVSARPPLSERCGDHAVAHRGVGDEGIGRPDGLEATPDKRPPPSRWTSAGSLSARTLCCICSAPPASSGSGSCGTTWSRRYRRHGARGHPPAGRQLRGGGLLRGARHRFSSPSTNSTCAQGMPRTKSGKRSRCPSTSRSSRSTRGIGTRRRPPSSRSPSTR